MACDCALIGAQIDAYAAAITVDQASVTVAQNKLLQDQTAYYMWNMMKYQCGCGGAMKTEEPPTSDLPITPEMLVLHLKHVQKSNQELYASLKKVS